MSQSSIIYVGRIKSFKIPYWLYFIHHIRFSKICNLQWFPVAFESVTNEPWDDRFLAEILNSRHYENTYFCWHPLSLHFLQTSTIARTQQRCCESKQQASHLHSILSQLSEPHVQIESKNHLVGFLNCNVSWVIISYISLFGFKICTANKSQSNHDPTKGYLCCGSDCHFGFIGYVVWWVLLKMVLFACVCNKW